jgi:hypothetical protein
MRAQSPLDPIQDFGDFVELPQPVYPLGTRINLHALDAPAQQYYFNKVRKEILRDTRKIVNKLKRDGFMKGMVGKKMLDFNKAQIRAKLEMMLHADVVEIAGHQPLGMHVTGAIANQCYLQNGQCHGGVRFEHYLLFRRTVDGQKLVYIHPYPIVGGCYIKSLLVPAPPSVVGG